MEPKDVKEREELEVHLVALERKETLEKMDLRVLMGLQALLVHQDNEALWVSLESEEKEA